MEPIDPCDQNKTCVLEIPWNTLTHTIKRNYYYILATLRTRSIPLYIYTSLFVVLFSISISIIELFEFSSLHFVFLSFGVLFVFFSFGNKFHTRIGDKCARPVGFVLGFSFVGSPLIDNEEYSKQLVKKTVFYCNFIWFENKWRKRAAQIRVERIYVVI